MRIADPVESVFPFRKKCLKFLPFPPPLEGNTMIIRSHWLTAALSLALLALFAAVPAHAKEPGTDPSISSGTFMWKNVGSGLCLEVSESGGDSLFIRKNRGPLRLER